ncbi:MAG: HD domain-containing protein [Bacilli bacterium]|nr:HD domain-containing protein [Bacilli bacterium]
MTLYMAMTILIACLMIAMTIHVLSYSGFNKAQKAWFIATFASIAFCSAAEFAAHCGYYDSKFKIPLTILTVLQFSISPCLAMLFAGALGLKYQGRIAVAYFGVNLLTEAISAPFKFIFSFTENPYARGDGFKIYIAMYCVSLAYLLVALVIAGRRFNHRDIGTIFMVVVVLVAGIVPMTINDELHVAYLAVAISSCLCYAYYNDLVTQDMNAELLNQQKRIAEMQMKITTGLANLIESRDGETGKHVARTSEYIKVLVEDCRAEGVYADVLTDHYIELLYTLAPMHDVGKILVSDKILKKPGKLAPEEYEEIKKHAVFGGDVVRQVLAGVTDEEYLSFASDIATYHHEKWDGNGYPKGLKGEEIPLCARLMTVADVFDALVSRRCYREALPMDQAIRLMKEKSGNHFDPKIAEVFLKHKEKYIEIRNRIGDNDLPTDQ